MGETKYNLDALSEKERDIIVITKKIDCIFDGFKIIKNSIDNDITRRDNINEQFNTLISDFQNIIESACNSSKIINKAVIEYRNSNHQIQNLLNGLLDTSTDSHGKDVIKIKHDEVSISEISIEQNWFEKMYNQFISKITHIKNFFQNNGVHINNKNYIKSIVEDENMLESGLLDDLARGTYSKLESGIFGKDKSANNTTIQEAGYIKELLDVLPGGDIPTESEIDSINNIVEKYEDMLINLLEKHPSSEIDIKDILNDMSDEITTIAEEHQDDFTWWFHMVKPFAPLDIKNRVTNGDKIWNKPYLYNGKLYAGDAGGNIIYGYIGASVFGVGYNSRSILKLGAGAGQLLSNKNAKGLKSAVKSWIASMATGKWGDNEGDADLVDLGFNEYIERNHPPYKILGINTYFERWLQMEIDDKRLIIKLLPLVDGIRYIINKIE